MMKKAATLCTGILMMILLANVVSGETMSVTSGEGLRGSQGHTITVALQNDIRLWGVSFDIVYDPSALEVIDVDSTAKSMQFDMFFWETPQPGLTRTLMVYISLNTLPADSGSIAEITFDVLNSALPGIYPLTLENVQLVDSMVTPLPVDIFNGQFEVSVILDSLRIHPRMVDVACSETQLFTATGYDAVGPPMLLDVDWDFSPANVGLVDPTGLFTATELGSGWIKATYQTWTDSTTVDVVPGEPVTLDIEPDSAIVVSGTQQQYTVTGLDACDNPLSPEVSWAVYPQTLGPIDQTGLFTGVTAGSGWIVASNNPTDSAYVTVVAGPVGGIEVSPGSATTTCADTVRFSASGYDANQNPIEITPDWDVDPESLGVIDAGGLFTAAKSGDGWVFARHEALSDSAYIFVVAGSLATITVQPDSLLILSGQSQQFAVTGYDACGNMLAVSADWSVFPAYLGIIDSEGLFTAQIEGEGWVFASGSTMDSAFVQVQRGQPTNLSLLPADTTVSTGDTVAYSAIANDGFNSWDVTSLTTFSTTDPTGSFTDNRYNASDTGTWETIGTYTFDSTTLTDTAHVTVLLTVLCDRGDVNCDKSITPGDALCAFWRSILGSFQEECICECSDEAADINCDGDITPGDALCIFWRAIQEEWPDDCDCILLAKELPGAGMAEHLKVGSVAGKPADVIRVPILIDQPEGFDAFGLELRYPAGLLEFQSLSASALTKVWTVLDGVNTEPGVVRIGGFNTESLSADELIPIAEVIFTVQEGAEGSGEFDLTNLTDDVAGLTVTQGRFTVNIKPTDYALHPNHPNPFNPHTDIRYQIADSRYPTHITMKIYNILGQKVRTLVDEIQEAGYYSVTWDGRDYQGQEVTSGIYFYRLTAGDFTATRQMILMK